MKKIFVTLLMFAALLAVFSCGVSAAEEKGDYAVILRTYYDEDINASYVELGFADNTQGTYKIGKYHLKNTLEPDDEINDRPCDFDNNNYFGMVVKYAISIDGTVDFSGQYFKDVVENPGIVHYGIESGYMDYCGAENGRFNVWDGKAYYGEDDESVLFALYGNPCYIQGGKIDETMEGYFPIKSYAYKIFDIEEMNAAPIENLCVGTETPGSYTVASYALNTTTGNSRYVVAASMTIGTEMPKKELQGIELSDATYTYDGTEKSLEVKGAPTDATVEFENNGMTDVGVYNVKAIITAPDYNEKILNATLTIKPKTIKTKGVVADDKAYDGTTNVTLSSAELTLVGVVDVDEQKITAICPENGSFADASVGKDKAVSFEDIILSGDKANNYILTQPVVKADILPVEVTVESIDFNAKIANLGGVLESDVEAVGLDFDKLMFEIVEEEMQDGEEVKDIKVKVKNFALKGNKAANYTVTTKELEATVSEDAVATVSVSAENGTVTGEGTYLIGSKITLKAQANSGYQFSGWYAGESSVSTKAEYSFVISEDTELAAKFKKKSSGGGGGGGGGGSSGGGGGSFGSGSSSSTSTQKEETKPETQPETEPETITPEIAPSTGNNFADLSGYDWASDAISTLSKAGIIKGTSETTFAPGKNITRADYIALIVRLFDLTSDNTENFADVNASDYFALELAIARNVGIVGGMGDNKFAPRNNITRQDMMVMLYRAMTKMNIVLENGEVSAADFSEVSDYAQEAVKALVSNGIINGKNGRIDPKANTTRAEVAVMLSRVLDLAK